MPDPIDPIEKGIKYLNDEILNLGKGESFPEEKLAEINNKLSEIKDAQGREIFGFDGVNFKVLGNEVKVKGIPGTTQSLPYVDGMNALKEYSAQNASSFSGDFDTETQGRLASEIAKNMSEETGINNDQFTKAQANAIQDFIKKSVEKVDQLRNQELKNAVEDSKYSEEDQQSIESTSDIEVVLRNSSSKFNKLVENFKSKLTEESKAKLAEFDRKAQEIANDNTLNDEQKTEKITGLIDNGTTEMRKNAASEKNAEKAKTWGEWIKEFIKENGGIVELLKAGLKFSAIILAIIFSVQFINKWRRAHTGCLIDVNDPSGNTIKTMKAVNLTCTGQYRNEIGNLQAYTVSSNKDCKVLPTDTPNGTSNGSPNGTPPPRPDGCQTCQSDLNSSSDDCPCPYNDPDNGAYASNWCDNKYLNTTFGSTIYNYRKNYLNWLDALVEVGCLLLGFIPNLLINPIPLGSLLDNLFKLLEMFGIIAAVFLGIYGIFFLLKEFGVIGGRRRGGGESKTVVEVIGQQPSTQPVTSTKPQQPATSAQPQKPATSAQPVVQEIDFGKLTEEEISSLSPENTEKYSKWLQENIVENKTFEQKNPSSRAAEAASSSSSSSSSSTPVSPIPPPIKTVIPFSLSSFSQPGGALKHGEHGSQGAHNFPTTPNLPSLPETPVSVSSQFRPRKKSIRVSRKMIK